MLFALHFFIKFCTHELSFAGPSTIELTLDVSSTSRYCLMYYRYYLSTVPLPSNLQISQCTETGLKGTVTDHSFRQTPADAKPVTEA